MFAERSQPLGRLYAPVIARRKTCVLTVSRSGIGRAAAFRLAAAGFHVVMVARDRVKATSVRDAILRKTPDASVTIEVAELSVLASVRDLASRLTANHERIDVLINNAGVMKPKCELTVDGIEATFAVNHVAVFLLTELLLERIIASAPARIINVGSEGHRAELLSGNESRIDFDTFRGDNRYRATKAYSQSRLAVLMFTYDLASQLDGTGVTANCVHPGMLGTHLGREFSIALTAPIHLISGKPERGAVALEYLASSLTWPRFQDSTSMKNRWRAHCQARKTQVSGRDCGKRRRDSPVSKSSGPAQIGRGSAPPALKESSGDHSITPGDNEGSH
jgi:NAD(P)-dependent dehydrogenase (short-subunit alcohol dehydrogenase family)